MKSKCRLRLYIEAPLSRRFQISDCLVFGFWVNISEQSQRLSTNVQMLVDCLLSPPVAAAERARPVDAKPGGQISRDLRTYALVPLVG